MAAVVELPVTRVTRLCRELGSLIQSAVRLSPTPGGILFQLVCASDPESGKRLSGERSILKKEIPLCEIEKYLLHCLWIASLRQRAIQDMRTLEEEA